MNQLDKKEHKAQSLITNILDVEDDFRMIKKKTHSVHPFRKDTISFHSSLTHMSQILLQLLNLIYKVHPTVDVKVS